MSDGVAEVDDLGLGVQLFASLLTEAAACIRSVPASILPPMSKHDDAL